MAVFLKCTVLCDLCGRSVEGLMDVGHHWSDGSCEIVRNDGIRIVDLVEAGMTMTGTRAICANQVACLARRQVPPGMAPPAGETE